MKPIEPENRPYVGTGVIIKRDGKVLLGKRINAAGAGEWGFPGGHLEFGESFEDCATREVLEETDLVVKDPIFFTVTNDYRKAEQTHYITIFLVCDYTSGTAKIMEPEKSEAWQWF